jgi:hypothetical protein
MAYSSVTLSITLAIFALAPAAPPAALATDGRGPNDAAIASQSIEKITPGHSTKSDVRALFGAPWRVVQFNDCGMAMDGQADETWEYRNSNQDRIHIEFDDHDVVHLLARIPDGASGAATPAEVAPKVAPMQPMSGM